VRQGLKFEAEILMLKILNPGAKPGAENLTRVTIGQRPAGGYAPPASAL